MSLFPPVSERSFPDYPNFPRTPSDDAREAFRLFIEDHHLQGGQLARMALDFEPSNDLAACAWAVAASFYMVDVDGWPGYLGSVIEPARACAYAMLQGPAPASLRGLSLVADLTYSPELGGLGRVMGYLGSGEVDSVIKRYWSDPVAFAEEGVRLAPDWPTFWITGLHERLKGNRVFDGLSTQQIRERALACGDRDAGGDWAQDSFGYYVSGTTLSIGDLSKQISRGGADGEQG